MNANGERFLNYVVFIVMTMDPIHSDLRKDGI